MSEFIRRVREAIDEDGKVERGKKKHTKNVILHMTPEQDRYLRERAAKPLHGKIRGLGTYMRQLLIMDMVRVQLQAEGKDGAADRTEG